MSWWRRRPWRCSAWTSRCPEDLGSTLGSIVYSCVQPSSHLFYVTLFYFNATDVS